MQTKFLSEEEIKDELNDYIYNVKIKYATLLNGSWGSGKTYFVKSYIKELEVEYQKNKDIKNNECKKPIYISLYGLNSVSEIKSRISLSLIRNEKVKKIIPFLDIGLELGSDFVSNKTFIKNSDNKLSKIINALYKIDNLIIFFDDLERCNININSILGYINELVEHNNVKVIIVADENKIGKVNYESNLELKYITALSENFKIVDKKKEKNSWDNSKPQNSNTKFEITKEEIINRAKHLYSEDSIYNEVKEKLIGKIIYYRANINNVYDKFVNEIITNEDAKETAIRNKQIILKHLDDNNHYNLRTVQFILQSFNRLISETLYVIEFDEIKNIYLNDLFSYCTIKSLRIKQGQNYYNWEKGQEFGTVYLGSEMLDYIYKNYVVGFRFVDDYLLHSYIEKTKLQKTLNSYKAMVLNEINNPNDPLYKLKIWWTISEEELTSIIDELSEKINSNYYGLELYSKIVNFLSRIEEMGVCKTKIKNIIKKLEDNISNNNVNGDYCEDRLFDGTQKTTEIYKKNIKKIRILVDEKKNNDLKSIIDSIFDSSNWGILLKEYCDTNNINFMNEKGFAYILNVDSLISNIKLKGIDQIYEFWYALQKIYGYSNIKDYYENDKDQLIQLKTELENITGIDKVKKFVLKKITHFLEDVINNL